MLILNVKMPKLEKTYHNWKIKILHHYCLTLCNNSVHYLESRLLIYYIFI